MCSRCNKKKKRDFVYVKSLAMKYKQITGETVVIYKNGEFFEFTPIVDPMPENVIEII